MNRWLAPKRELSQNRCLLSSTRLSDPARPSVSRLFPRGLLRVEYGDGLDLRVAHFSPTRSDGKRLGENHLAMENRIVSGSMAVQSASPKLD